MGIKSDFVVATEAEVRGFVDEPHAHAQLWRFAVAGLLSEHVDALVTAAAELAGSDDVLEDAFDAGPDGPWAYRIPPATTRVLGAATPAIRHELGARWRVIDAEAEHEAVRLGSLCTDLIGPICDLAARVGGERQLFLVISI